MPHSINRVGSSPFNELRQPFLTPAIILARCSRMRSRLSSRAACPHLAKFGSHAFTRTFILMLNLNCEFPFHQTRRRAFALRARSTSASSQVVLEDRVNRTHAILPIDFFAFRIGPAAVGNADFVDSTARASQFGDNFRLNRATISRTGETVTAM